MPAAPNHVFQPYISYIYKNNRMLCMTNPAIKNASEKRIPSILKLWEPTFIQQENFLMGYTPGNQNLHPSPPGAKSHPHLWTYRACTPVVNNHEILNFFPNLNVSQAINHTRVIGFFLYFGLLGSEIKRS